MLREKNNCVDCVLIYIFLIIVLFPFLLVCQEQSEHGFKEAAKLEAVNLLSPENIHVATVTRVKGQYIWLSLEGNERLTKELVWLERTAFSFFQLALSTRSSLTLEEPVLRASVCVCVHVRRSETAHA